MPLELLGTLVVVGIGGMVLLLHLMGWTRSPAFETETAAETAFLLDYPGATIEATLLADDRKSALFLMGHEIGFAAPFGEGRLTRKLGQDDLKQIVDGPNHLTLHLNDYTAPKLTVNVAEPNKAEWFARLQRLKGA